jgi:hypothetical protein
MKGPLFFTLLYLFTIAWAGGYQGALERVWLYQAFVIDYELNPEADRTIGVQCQTRNWNDATKTCSNWENLVRHSLPFPEFRFQDASTQKGSEDRQASHSVHRKGDNCRYAGTHM